MSEAVEYHLKRLTIKVKTPQVGNRSAEGQAYGAPGDLHRTIQYLNKYLNISKEVGDKSGEQGAYGNLANVYQ